MPKNPFPNVIARYMTIIPFPNAIAGLLIGAVNDLWLARILLPLVWGTTWCFYQSFYVTNKEIREKSAIRRDGWYDNESWSQGFRGFLRTHPVIGFYFVEYFTAFITALVFSVLAGLARVIFS